MHRHGYQGRKLGRKRDQRSALIKSLLEALITHEAIETTQVKAKELRPHIEKLVTRAKKGDLHSRRIVMQHLQTKESAHKLVDDIAKRYSKVSSGYVRVTATSVRRGDNAQMARIEFVKVDTSKDVPKKAAKPATKKENA